MVLHPCKRKSPEILGRLLIVNAMGRGWVTDLLQLGDVGDVVVPSLSLLLLQLDGDAAHRRPLQPLHEMRDEAGDLVAQRLRGDQGDLETHGDGYVILVPKLTVEIFTVSQFTVVT